MSKFINDLNNSVTPDPQNNVFADIWKQYERVVLHSLITSFGLDFLVHDQHGGDVDTVRGVRAGVYKNPDNAAAYQARGDYDGHAYHADPRYLGKAKAAKEAYNVDFTPIDDAYVPGRKLHFTTASAARHAGETVGTLGRANLDHVVAAKEIHDDAGRILAGVDGVDLANSEYNLRWTNEALNKSKGADSVETVIERGVKGEPLPDEVAERMRAEDKQAREHMDKEINRAYYSSARFLGDAALAACKRGVEMGIRQAVGFYFLEVWLACEEEFKGIDSHCEIGTVIAAIKTGVAKGSENALKNYKELFLNFGEGFIAGAMASVTTTLINIFITTDKNTIRYIRQASASIVQAGNILLINPNNLLVGEQLKSATIVLATGASVIAGTAVGDLIEKTPIYSIPEVGQFVQTFCSVLVSGLLSCTLLVMLDRSKFVNHIITEMNKYQDASRSYALLAEEFARIAAELEGYDIRQFHIEVARYGDITTRIETAMDEEELECLMASAYTAFDIDMPWGDDAVGAGAAGYGAVQAGKAIKLNRRAKKMRDEALQRHEEHYKKVQGALEAAGTIKLTAIDSFDDFADQMAKIQGRPEFCEINYKGVKLPVFTADELKTISNNVAFALEGAIGAGAGAGLGIAVCGLNVVALGPGLLIGGIGLMIAGGHIKKKAIENNKQAKQLVKDVDAIIKQYDELAVAASMLEKHISAVYAQYEKHLAKMKKILAKKSLWSNMSEKEQAIIENTILLVGMLYKLCKIELIVNEKKTEKINTEEVKSVGAEVDATLKHTKHKLFFT